MSDETSELIDKQIGVEETFDSRTELYRKMLPTLMEAYEEAMRAGDNVAIVDFLTSGWK